MLQLIKQFAIYRMRRVKTIHTMGDSENITKHRNLIHHEDFAVYPVLSLPFVVEYLIDNRNQAKALRLHVADATTRKDAQNASKDPRC